MYLESECDCCSNSPVDCCVAPLVNCVTDTGEKLLKP